MEEEYSKGDMRYLSRWCLNVPSSWKPGRCIVLTPDAILDLCKKAKFEGGVVVDGLPPTAETKPVLTIQDGISTERMLQKLLNSVRSEKTQDWHMGYGSLGKTTIMKILNNLPKIAEMFEIVIWVTVSENCRTRKLQSEIVQCLSLGLSNDVSEESIASKLFQKLTTMKFLLLMDDVWQEVDLHSIGAPCPNQENGCKLVLTTRNQNVCHEMATDEEIKIEPLSDKEAWKLFRDEVGEIVDSPSIQPLAKCVVDECDGLPLAIIVVGKSLRKTNKISIWKNTVQELSSPDTSTIYGMEKLYKTLQFSYDRLEDDNIRNCFLYAGLYPEDHEVYIFILIEYWRAEGLISSGSTLKDGWNKGHVVLHRLIHASLILKSDKSYVKM